MPEDQKDQTRPNQGDPKSDRQGSHDREVKQAPGSQADNQKAAPQQEGEGKIGGDAQRAAQDKNATQGTGGTEGNTGNR